MLKIGSVCFSNPLISAPLAGISDFPFRELARYFGVSLTYSEMISSAGICAENDKSKNFTFVKGEHPISAQIFGRDPDMIAYAAQYFEDQGADIIDINFGCPVKKVSKQGSGSALQRDINRSKEVITTVRKAISIPLTIKCRLGWNPAEENYLEMARIAEGEGVDAFCLHPRYAVQMFKGVSYWSKFHDLKPILSIPIIGSGDIKTSEEISFHLNEYPVDFIMLGRGLMSNPWIISDYLKKEHPPLLETILMHYDLMLQYFDNELLVSTRFRKFIGKYVKGLSNASELRVLGNELTCRDDLLELFAKINV
ncbi:MAG: hypothetical protein A2Y40_09745 [Candidatus Margulisbacteria bacterium GWF2_35_9]|nr:MAG: hypothetical protein A2Y40_09745 [Candidatus Margulisbacteria bacterium GWF2_35_9]